MGDPVHAHHCDRVAAAMRCHGAPRIVSVESENPRIRKHNRHGDGGGAEDISTQHGPDECADSAGVVHFEWNLRSDLSRRNHDQRRFNTIEIHFRPPQVSRIIATWAGFVGRDGRFAQKITGDGHQRPGRHFSGILATAQASAAGRNGDHRASGCRHGISDVVSSYTSDLGCQ